MARDRLDLDRLFAKEPQSILQRTLIAEYLFTRGCLMSDIMKLPTHVADHLITDACRFADQKLVEMDAIDNYPWKMRLLMSFN